MILQLIPRLSTISKKSQQKLEGLLYLSVRYTELLREKNYSKHQRVPL